MLYQSTRNKSINVESAFAIKQGLSEEGGLFVPLSFPQIKSEELEKLVNVNYIERAKYVLGLFLTDFTKEEIAECAEKAYGNNKFGLGDTAPLHKLDDSAYILELWHGPTCAFKDMALQILPHLLTMSIKKTGEKKTVVILVATSGDTGKAALEGFRDVGGTKIIVFYPEDGVSNIQKLQMTTQDGNNVYVAAIKGNFDDAQTGVKKIFTNKELKKTISENEYIFSSANSINWGRLVPQIVYYISAYCDLIKKGEIINGEEVNICVPTGNFGNILAAFYAKSMGLPIAKFICASNKNNILTDFINTGIYDKNRDFHTTMSPSMDILISSNLERLLFDISGRDDECVGKWMSDLNETGRYELDEKYKDILKKSFWADFCDDENTSLEIRNIFEKYNYTIDTHTAVAVNVFTKYKKETNDKTKTIIASTASPFKFNKDVLDAFGEDTAKASDFELLEILQKKAGLDIPSSLNELKDKKVIFNETYDQENMIEAVGRFLNIDFNV